MLVAQDAGWVCAVPQVRQARSFAQAVVSAQQLVSLQVLQAVSANSRPHAAMSQVGCPAHSVEQSIHAQLLNLV
jgi:hypothetical protein